MNKIRRSKVWIEGKLCLCQRQGIQSPFEEPSGLLVNASIFCKAF